MFFPPLEEEKPFSPLDIYEGLYLSCIEGEGETFSPTLRTLGPSCLYCGLHVEAKKNLSNLENVGRQKLIKKATLTIIISKVVHDCYSCVLCTFSRQGGRG